MSFILLVIVFFVSHPASAYRMTAQEKLNEVSKLINQGIKFHAQRNYRLAIESFSTAYKLDTRNKEVLQNLSIAHNNYGKYLAERTDKQGALQEFRAALYFDANNDVARDNLNTQLEDKGVDPLDANVRVTEAIEERERGNAFSALGELNESIRIKPLVRALINKSRSYHILALRSIHNKVSFTLEALKALDEAKKLEPKNADILVAEGDIYIADGKISKGLKVYKAAVELQPDNIGAQEALVNGYLASIRVAPNLPLNFVGLGTAYQLMGNLEQAEKAFRRAIDLDPGNELANKSLSSLQVERTNQQTSLFLKKAVKQQQAGDIEGAIGNYIKAVRVNPRNADIHFNIGTAFQAKGDWVKAEKAYKRAIDLKPDHPEANAALEHLGSTRQEAMVSEAFDTAVKYQKDGNYQKAIEIYLKIQKDKPEDDNLLYNIGAAYQASKEYDKAKEYFQKAYDTKADTAYQEAIDFVNQTQTKELLDTGLAAQTSGNNELAVQKYKELITLLPTNADAWYNLAIAEQNLQNNDGALKAYLKAADLDPVNQADALFFAALIYEDQKNMPEAIKLYEKYMNVNPNAAYILDARERLEYIKSLL